MVTRAPTRLIAAILARLIVLMCGFAVPPNRAIADFLVPPSVDGEMTLLPGVDDAAEGEELASEPFLLVDRRWAKPRPSARIGAVLLQRSRPRSELLMTELVTGKTLLDPYDLVFPFRGGVDVGLLWRGTVADVEFRYFGVEAWTASEGPVVTSIGAQLHLPDEDPFVGPLGAELFGSSSLHSLELNLRRNVTPNWSWLAGLRYLAFRDAMGLIAGDPTLTDYGRVVFGTTNNLFGMQIGADGILWHNGRRFRVEGALKAGVYANGVGLSLDGSETSGTDSFHFDLGRDVPAFVGDLNFVGVYQLDDRWALRAGYQMLWLSGVAVGSMQIHGFEPDGFSVNTSATVFFHGALLGLESNW